MMEKLGKILLVSLIVTVGLAGCGPKQSEAKIEANQRWNDVRARVLVSVGEDQFKAGDLDSSRSSAQEALALAPMMAPAQVLLARIEIETGNYAKAQQHLQVASELTADSNPEVCYLMGVALEKRRHFEEALTQYEKARALDPGKAAYVLASAEMIVTLGRPAEALALIEAKLDGLEQTGTLYRAAGDLAMVADRPDRAVEHYSQACLLAGDDLAIKENLAKACFFAGQPRQTIRLLNDLRTEESYENQAWVHAMLGECYLSDGRPQEARDSFEVTTRLESYQARHWANLAKAALACKDTKRAILSANQALKLEAGLMEAELVLGCALLSDGQAEQANAVLQAAVSRHPRQATLTCLLGRSYGAMGQHDKARECYRASLEIEPNNALAQQMLASASPSAGS